MTQILVSILSALNAVENILNTALLSLGVITFILIASGNAELSSIPAILFLVLLSYHPARRNMFSKKIYINDIIVRSNQRV